MFNQDELVNKAQPDLAKFYLYAKIYLSFEAFACIVWLAQMIMSKVIYYYPQYRVISLTYLFHFSSPIAMYGVIQQAQNNNSISWWVFFYFFIAVAADSESLIEVCLIQIYRELHWAWGISVGVSTLNITLSLTGFSLFTYWFVYKKPKSIPIPAVIQEYQKKQIKNYF